MKSLQTYGINIELCIYQTAVSLRETPKNGYSIIKWFFDIYPNGIYIVPNSPVDETCKIIGVDIV